MRLPHGILNFVNTKTGSWTETGGHNWWTLRIVITQNVYTYIFTKKENIAVLLTSADTEINASRLINNYCYI